MAHDDNVQHGIDDNSSGDAGKGAALGGLGGAAVGAMAGSVIGPVGTLIGAAVGAVSGAVASGAAVAAVDAVDNDNTVSGIGGGATSDVNTSTSGSYTDTDTSGSYMTGADGEHGHNVVTGEHAHTGAGAGGLTTGALVGGTVGAALGGPVGAVVGGTAGSLLGGVAGDASEAAAEGTPVGSGYTTGTTTGSTYATDTTYSTGATTPMMDTTTTTDVSTYPTVTRAEYDSLDEAGRQRVQLIEEELHVGKDSREVGEVEISKHIVEEQVTVPVTLEREEIIITRTAGTGGVVGEGAFTDEVISVPVREEFATVTKTAHVAEEIEIEKRVTSQQTTVGGTVRHEELDVKDVEGKVRIEGDIDRTV